jgi:hypothetical protein
MYTGNNIPTTDLSRPVDEEVLDEIQARLDNGWRVRNDMQLLLDFARKTLDEARQQVNRGICEGVSCAPNGCSQSNSELS